LDFFREKRKQRKNIKTGRAQGEQFFKKYQPEKFQKKLQNAQKYGTTSQFFKNQGIDENSDLYNFILSKDIEDSTKNFKGFNKYLKETNKTSSVLSKTLKGLGSSLLNIGAGMLAGIVADLFITGFIKLTHLAEDARKRVQETTQEWQQQDNQLQSTIGKYEELNKRLQDSNLSLNSYKDAKSELTNIQNELVKKYGVEASQLDLVNGKYDEQIKKLQKIRQKEAVRYLGTNGKDIQATRDFLNNTVTVKVLKGSHDNLESKYIDILNQYSVRKTRDNTSEVGDNKYNWSIAGTREEIYQQLTALYNEFLENFDPTDKTAQKILNDISSAINLKTNWWTSTVGVDADEIPIQKSSLEAYGLAVLQADKEKYKVYSSYQEAVDSLNEAYKSGDVNKVNSAIRNFEDLKKQAEAIKKESPDTATSIDNVTKSVSNALEKTYQMEQKIKNGVDFATQDGLFEGKTFDDMAEKLQGLTDEDLQKIVANGMNYDENSNLSIEQYGFFKGLMDGLELSAEDADILIQKLIELGKIKRKITAPTDNEIVQSYLEAQRGYVQDKKELLESQNFKYGNIDLANRPYIYWNDKTISKNRTALESWGDNPEDYKGTTSTVMGSFGEYGNIQIPVAFTPVIDDGTGEGKVLDKDTVEQYIDTLVGQATDENGVINTDKLFQLDTQGLEIQGTKISGIIADVGDTAAATSTEMHELQDFYVDYAKAFDKIKTAAKNANLSVSMFITSARRTKFGDVFNLKDTQGQATTLGNLSASLDELQNAYTTITSTIKEYNSVGYFSVDTLQSILSLGDEYLQYMFDENGNLVMNKKALQELTIARLEELRAETLLNLSKQIDNIKSEADAQQWLAKQTLNTASSMNTLTEAMIINMIASKDLSDETKNNLIASFVDRMNQINSLFDKSRQGLLSSFSTAVGKDAQATAKQIKDANNQLESSTISNEIDKIKISIDGLSDSIAKLKDSESLLPESDFLGKITLSQKSIELTTKKTSALIDEFNRLRGIVPSTSESANTLANRMKEVGEEIFESKKAIYEYQTEIAKNYMSALNGLTTNSTSMTDEAVSNFEKNMENLEKGSLTGLRFNVTPNVPLSAVEKQESEIEQLRDMWQSYYNDITAMQKTALELKHAEDVRSYNESMADLNEATTAAVSTIKDTNDTTSEIQKADHEEKKTETQGYVNDTKIIINDFHAWLANNPTKSPALDNNAWHSWVEGIKGYVKQVEDVFDKDWLGDNQLSKALGATPKGNALANDIKEYLGTKYVWGGTSPNGFDCSGLMQYVYEKNGINIPRTTYEQYPKSKKVDYSDIQPGDLIFTDFNKSGLPEHVGMYIGNDTVIAASSSNGKVVEQKLSGGYWNTGKVGRFYATGTKDYGIAGENYKKEYAINKKTGEWSIVDSPTLFDKGEYDIVGEKVSEKIDKPIGTYANGTIPVPEGLGKYTTWMNWMAVTDKSSQQYKLRQATGNNYDSEGYGTINGRKVVAMTNTFGKIGDYVNIHLTDGTVIQGVIGDEKDQTWAHGTPANKWGHENGQNVIEYVTNWKRGHENPSLNGAGVAYVDNLGNYFDNPTIGLDNITSAQANAQKNKINPYVEKMGQYIKEKRQLSSENDETFYKNMAQLSKDTKSNAETLGSIYDELKDSAGTNMYDAKESAFVTQASKWIQDTMTRSSELILDETKRQFETAKESYDLAEDYFNKRVAEGASASELEALREGMKTLEETMSKASDAYVKQSENYTKLRIADQQLERQRYQDDITKTNKKIEDADYEIETNQLLYDRVKSNNAIVDEARSQVAEVLGDSKYQDILAGQDIEKWFNGENEQSAYFKKYLQAVSEANPEDSVLLTQVFEVIQDAKKAEAEALKQITEDEKQMALNQVEAYIKLQERKKEVLDYVYEKNQAIIDAETKRNDLLQSIRDTERDYTAELKANKDLGQWLDEDTRALLFNEEDYSAVMGKISNIKNEIYQNEIWYQNEIAKLDENDIYQKEMLTQQLENMNARSQEKLEIAKQELDVAKKTAEYNNIAKERDTQIILGNRKVNVANPESLYNAAKEMSNAQILLNDTQTKYNENEAVRQKQETNDLIKNESAALSALTQALNDMPEKLRVAIASVLPSFEISTAEKANIEKYSPNWIAEKSGYIDDKTRDIIEENKADGYDVTTNYTHNKDYIKQAFVNGQITREQYERIMGESDRKHGLKDAKWEGNRYNADTKNKDNILKTDVPPKYPSSVFINGIEYKKLVEDMSPTEKIQMDYPNIPMVNWKDMLSYDSQSGFMFPIVSWDNMSMANPLSKSEDNSTNYTIQGDIVVNEASDVKEIFEKSTELIKQKSQNTNNMRK